MFVYVIGLIDFGQAAHFVVPAAPEVGVPGQDFQKEMIRFILLEVLKDFL